MNGTPGVDVGVGGCKKNDVGPDGARAGGEWMDGGVLIQKFKLKFRNQKTGLSPANRYANMKRFQLQELHNNRHINRHTCTLKM